MARLRSKGKLKKDHKHNSRIKEAVTYPENGKMIPMDLSGLCLKNVSHLERDVGTDVNCAAVGRTFNSTSMPLIKILSNP